jgi:hypothetical protein
MKLSGPAHGHPPAPMNTETDLIDHIERISSDFPNEHRVLAGDFNALLNFEVITRTGMMSAVTVPTIGL